MIIIMCMIRVQSLIVIALVEKNFPKTQGKGNQVNY